jgi:1-deoxy-D-xylulose-5-phosphate synthase
MPTNYLDQINSPADLKGLSRQQLVDLAAECRERIIATTSETGGHLAPNLGAVELTIALHRVLNSPEDKIIWDVGHQCYTHKLLTGRREQFATIRQQGGLSGFPRREESPHDAFGTGHGSTSISAALGLAKARDIRGGTEKIVAVIGDGSLTGGLALEALNQAGAMKADLVVVLNDNEMSIGRNVGAMSAYLARIRAAYVEPAVQRTRRDVARMLNRLRMGDAMLEAMDRFRDGLKQLVVPGMLFEEFGFTYLGPIDGHDIGPLVEVFEHACRLRSPVLVHVFT